MAPTLNEEEIDDLIYLARVNELSEFKEELEKLTTREKCDIADIVRIAKDEQSGNGVLHMAAANGHVGMFSPLSGGAFAPSCHFAPQSISHHTQKLIRGTNRDPRVCVKQD